MSANQSNSELQDESDLIKSFTEASDKPHGYMNCPHCGKRFNIKDVKQMQEQRKALMLQTLISQGFSLREIGKLFNMHPQSVKYWSEKFRVET